jgi:hypothetical protein
MEYSFKPCRNSESDYVTISNTTKENIVATWSISWMDQDEEDTFSRSKELDPGEMLKYQGMFIADQYRYITKVSVKTKNNLEEKACELDVERLGEQVHYDVEYILKYGKCLHT